MVKRVDKAVCDGMEEVVSVTWRHSSFLDCPVHSHLEEHNDVKVQFDGGDLGKVGENIERTRFGGRKEVG